MKKTLFSLLLLNIAVVLYGQSPITNQRLFDTIPFLPDHYARRVAQFESESVVSGSIIFLGNSITEGGNWNELTGAKTMVNRGIGGDITFGLLRRLNEIIRWKPAKVFILIGINDIGKDIPDAVIADNCGKIVLKLKQGSPQTKVYLQSILPLNPKISGFPQHYDKEDHVLQTNLLLRHIAEASGAEYINLYPLFLDRDQRLDPKFTHDGLHLTPAAYRKWVDFLRDTGRL
jgi:lysophospholipase L1-like esterase